MSTVRPAAVAGMFYPASAKALAEELDELLGGVEHLSPRLGFPKALVVPHAGYVYSGPIAAHAYDSISPARGIVKRVVLLGPVHRVPVRGLALPGADFFETPLGRIEIDAEAVRALSSLPQVVTSASAHALEHSLEVQLPFLQKALGRFSLVPLAVGTASAAEVAQALERLWGGPETLVVISTDLSHYHDYERARAIDGHTIARIAGLATDIDHDEACGATPLNGFLLLSKNKKLKVELLAACNSGDTAGGKKEVVGYSAFAVYEGKRNLAHEDAGKVLLGIARGAIDSNLEGKKYFQQAKGDWLAQAGASFVTLTKEGALRGCIGSLVAEQPLGEDVARNAVAAAFRDPRFPALTLHEWPGVRVEVSLLSSPKPVRFADEEDLLRQVVAGEDGIILEYSGRRATFLPQVWEALPDKQVFFSELLKKAGLSGARLARCSIQRYRVAKWKETPAH